MIVRRKNLRLSMCASSLKSSKKFLQRLNPYPQRLVVSATAGRIRNGWPYPSQQLLT